MNISAIYSTDHRYKILYNIIFETDSIKVSHVARKTKTSKGLVSKYLNLLVENEVLTKLDGGFKVLNSPATKSIKILLN